MTFIINNNIRYPARYRIDILRNQGMISNSTEQY
jgi:hypothetical protein